MHVCNPWGLCGHVPARPPASFLLQWCYILLSNLPPYTCWWLLQWSIDLAQVVKVMTDQAGSETRLLLRSDDQSSPSIPITISITIPPHTCLTHQHSSLLSPPPLSSHTSLSYTFTLWHTLCTGLFPAHGLGREMPCQRRIMVMPALPPKCYAKYYCPRSKVWDLDRSGNRGAFCCLPET